MWSSQGRCRKEEENGRKNASRDGRDATLSVESEKYLLFKSTIPQPRQWGSEFRNHCDRGDDFFTRNSETPNLPRLFSIGGGTSAQTDSIESNHVKTVALIMFMSKR